MLQTGHQATNTLCTKTGQRSCFFCSNINVLCGLPNREISHHNDYWWDTERSVGFYKWTRQLHQHYIHQGCPLVPSAFPYQLSIFFLHTSLLQHKRATHKGHMEWATNICSKHGNQPTDIKRCWASTAADNMTTAVWNICNLMTTLVVHMFLLWYTANKGWDDWQNITW